MLDAIIVFSLYEEFLEQITGLSNYVSLNEPLFEIIRFSEDSSKN